MSFAQLLSATLLLLLGLLSVGSLLNVSNHPHWFIRGWDFPRVQIVVIGWILCAAYCGLRFWVGAENVYPALPIASLAIFLTLWHGFRIVPYTTIFPKQAASTPRDEVRDHRVDASTIRIVMTNVEMENEQHELWVQTMRQADPDMLLVLEINERWVEATKEFAKGYPHHQVIPQDNWYGMMLLSRLPLINCSVHYRVQDDVPSVDTHVQLDNGSLIRFIGVHPRPPEPIRDNDATARDAELTLWGTELSDESGPVIIGGDLNDVAWSQTTRLFLRTSGLLDPRRGRGFFNSFHTRQWFMRFPLDHVFHSPHFTVNSIQRMEYVGSDHFPIQIDLRFNPSDAHQHDVLESKPSDAEEMEQRLQRAVDDESLNVETVND